MERRCEGAVGRCAAKDRRDGKRLERGGEGGVCGRNGANLRVRGQTLVERDVILTPSSTPLKL